MLRVEGRVVREGLSEEVISEQRPEHGSQQCDVCRKNLPQGEKSCAKALRQKWAWHRVAGRRQDKELRGNGNPQDPWARGTRLDAAVRMVGKHEAEV